MLGWQLYCHPCELPVFFLGGAAKDAARKADITDYRFQISDVPFL
jgi:hypothetical protein